jgi:uncharacterized protein YlxW (UPF0749 family)
MNTFIQLSNEDIDTALSHDLREEVRRCNKHIAAMQARIEKLETAANKAVEWLHHYPNPDNMEEQAESNRRRALNILEKALTK